MLTELNQLSPYKVFRVTETESLEHYEFISDGGIRYYIHFDICEYFTNPQINENSYVFSFGSFTIGQLSDTKIKLTIIEVIKYFFTVRENILLFTCDDHDERSLCRKKLFDRWHKEYSGNVNTTKINESVSGDDFQYHSSLIIRRDNLNYNECIEAFKDFHSDLRK